MKNSQRKVLFEVMGSRSTKYGGVESFSRLLAEESPEFEFHFIYNERPWSTQYLSDLERVNAITHVIDTRKLKFIFNSFKFIYLLLVYRPKIVHFHFSDSFVLWSIFAKLFGAKVVKTNHCCIVKNNNQVLRFSELTLKRKILLFGGKIYNVFDGIINVSKYVDNQFHSIFGNRLQTKVIYLGTNPAKETTDEERKSIRHKLGISDNQTVITSILFADVIKGCDILLKSLPTVNEDFVCLIIGLEENKIYTQNMHKIASELGIEDKIRWIGLTNEVYKYLNITNLYIQPSRSDALPLASVEAISFGIPVIATNVGGLPEITPYTFEKESHEALSLMINSIIKDMQNLPFISAKALERWESRFKISVGIKQTLELYKQIIS